MDAVLPQPIVQRLRRQGERLAAARSRRGWTQAELAQRLGSSRRTIVNLESGQPGVAWGTVIHAFWLLDLSLDDNAYGIAEPSPSRHRARGRKSGTIDLDF